MQAGGFGGADIAEGSRREEVKVRFKPKQIGEPKRDGKRNGCAVIVALLHPAGVDSGGAEAGTAAPIGGSLGGLREHPVGAALDQRRIG